MHMKVYTVLREKYCFFLSIPTNLRKGWTDFDGLLTVIADVIKST